MENKKRVLLVCSDGGHLAQMLELKELFEKYDYLLVTERAPSTIPLAKTYNLKFVRPRPEGKNRKLGFYISLIQNSFSSLKILLTHRPKVILTTGSHTAVPFCILAKILGMKVVWILSYARINSKASSANLIYPIANRFLVQWPNMTDHYKKGIYVGSIY
ncbi:PssD/Cps14F family polysaccharide biosynthesis glycosyltransferase [Algoriphagus sp. NG3]|uniref:PssD/Cps14F family polysaccharide biosynthesis glycosyltransferase n=1 Tax=Algoriphagus sp. NG3 TaxID=3097546 RepID=UPI002A83A9F3|nr:PssD/Cps14F family polysaccharide biosynthesis glycosyltransferase [Algoriphagus sp. NG3]WPR73536.1 PssD/Cps14F family polysaccharide biosynthesis glycosyltransferase [Algoriphagus sp. NG3]